VPAQVLNRVVQSIPLNDKQLHLSGQLVLTGLLIVRALRSPGGVPIQVLNCVVQLIS
jgi:hypothetical protein